MCPSIPLRIFVACTYAITYTTLIWLSPVQWIKLVKEGISEEMVQHSHDMFMDTWWSGQICNLKSTCLFLDLLERVDALVLYINIQLK